MAYRFFGGTPSDVTTDANGNIVASFNNGQPIELTVWTARTGGTQPALKDSAGATVTTVSPIASGDDKGLIEFQADSDSTDFLWLDRQDGSRRMRVDLRTPAWLTVDAGNSTFAAQSTLKVGTKRATFATGGPGTTTALTTSATTGSATTRVPVRLAVATTRWRVKLRNYNTITQAGGSAATGKGIAFGLSNTSANAYESGQFAGSTSTTIVGSDFTIPTDGSYYVSPWVTDPALQFTPNREYMIAYAYQTAPSGTVHRGTGTAFYWADNVTTGLNSNNTVAKMSATPFDMQVEYEFTGDQRIGLFIGDSITEGVGGRVDTTNMNDAQPIYRSWPMLWAARAHCVAIDVALSGTTAAQWATPTQDRWNRVDLATTVPDFAYIGFGSNDANATTSLAQFQTDLKTVIDNVRAKIGADKPIYLGTVTPRSFETVTKEPLRVSYNTWLRTMPYGVAGVLDFDRVLKDPADSTKSLAEFVNGDNTHPSRAGYNAMSLSVPQLAAQ